MADENVTSAPVETPATEDTSVENTANEAASTGDDSQDLDSGTVGGKGERAAPPPSKKWKLKDGALEKEVSSEDELVSLARLGLASNRRFQEAAKTRKEYEQMLETLKNAPRDVLEKHGVDARKFAEELLIEQLQEEMLTPEQKKARDMEKRLKGFEKQEADRKAAEEERVQNEYKAKVQEEYSQKFIGALDKAGIPKNELAIIRMVELTKQALDMDLDLEVDDIARLVREDYMMEHKTLYSSMNGDQLLELFPELADRVFEAKSKKRKPAVPPSLSSRGRQTPSAKPAAAKEERPMTTREFREKLGL